MPIDHYAVLRALLRAEAARNTPKPQAQVHMQAQKEKPQQPSKERERG